MYTIIYEKYYNYRINNIFILKLEHIQLMTIYFIIFEKTSHKCKSVNTSIRQNKFLIIL